MQKFIIGLVVGLILGCVAAQLILSENTNPAMESLLKENQELVEQVRTMDLQVTEKQRQLEKLTQERLAHTKVESVVESPLPPQGTKPEVATPSEKPKTATGHLASQSAMFKAGMELRNRQKMDTLKTRLNLTPYQESQIQQAMDRELTRTEKIISGEYSTTDSKTPSVNQTANSLLTPEQLAQYNEIEAEERRGQLEMMATMELNQSTAGLGLSEEQKDKMFQTLYKLQEDQIKPKINAPDQGERTALDFLEMRSQEKLAAMATILTPQQLEIYRKNIDRQTEMNKQFLEKMEKKPQKTP